MSFNSRYVSRSDQANKILAILKDYKNSDLENCICLDVGCGNGAILQNISEDFKFSVGIDIDERAIIVAKNVNNSENSEYAVANSNSIPLASNSVDIIICAQVYEHVRDQSRLAAEIWRVLLPGGVCFFSGPNRLAFMEEHYWLLFLSWLPRHLANLYMRLFNRGDVYDTSPLFPWQTRNLWSSFIIYDYNLKIIRDPEKFAFEDRLNKFKWIRYIPSIVLRPLIFFLPNYNWILVKPNEKRA